jgi:phosphoglycerate dehydrogenase-like enzyme
VKVVYILRNPGLAARTPPGWESAVVAPGPDGVYREEDVREIEDADFLVVGLEPVDDELLEHAGRLKLIQRLGRGYDNIDVEAAERRGIPVCGMPDFNAAAVAEHTVMLMLALLRRVFESTLLMKAGSWPLADVVGHGIYELAGRTVGIVGVGAIGRAVAQRVAAFDAGICWWDREPLQDGPGKAVPLDELLRRADIVTLHLPLTPETEGMIGRAQLAMMKSTALLVNTARGRLVDELALCEALEQGGIAGAGLDVFADEPLDRSHPLRRCPNLLLTPHTGGQTREAMERMVAVMLDNLARVSRGVEPRFLLTRDDSTA